jgi:integrase
VRDQEHALDHALALVVELEEARPRHQLLAAQATEECDLARGEGEARVFGEADQAAGQIDERALLAVGADGEYEPPVVRVEHAGAAGEDFAEHRVEATQALRQVMTRAVAWGMIDVNPAKQGVDNPQRRRTEKRPFESWAQLAAVASRLDACSGALVMFAAATGLRPGEWVALEQRDIDPVARVVYVRRAYRNGRLKCTKTEGSVRAVPLQAVALEALERLPARADTELLFPSLRGAYFDLHNFRTREWKPAQLAAGITPLRRVYDLRHTFATFALRAGISTFDLSRYMGASLTMIDRHYGHLARDGCDHAINLLDNYSQLDDADVHQVDVAWTLQQRAVATPANRRSP